jgi:hypothetical protein
MIAPRWCVYLQLGFARNTKILSLVSATTYLSGQVADAVHHVTCEFVPTGRFGRILIVQPQDHVSAVGICEEYQIAHSGTAVNASKSSVQMGRGCRCYAGGCCTVSMEIVITVSRTRLIVPSHVWPGCAHERIAARDSRQTAPLQVSRLPKDA